MDSKSQEKNMSSDNITPKIIKLGEGVYGQVYTTANGMAEKKQPMEHSAIREYTFLKYLGNHPFIIDIQEARLDDCHLHFKMPKGIHSLHDCEFQELSVEYITVLFRQILECVKYIHSRGVIHRDLKLDNILLFPDDKIKIIDFGISTIDSKKHISGCEHTGNMSAVCYRAPEMAYGNPYNEAVDMWSCGVILLRMLEKDDEFRDMFQAYMKQENKQKSQGGYNESRVIFRFFSYTLGSTDYYDKLGECATYKSGWMRKKAPELPNMVRVKNDHPLSNLAFKLLEWDPTKRITADEALKHPCFYTESLSTPTPSPQLTSSEYVWKLDMFNIQKDITPKMRVILFDWLWNVYKKTEMPKQCLVAAYAIVDMYIRNNKVTRAKLQLLGCAAQMIVSSIYEENFKDASFWNYIADRAYTEQQINQMVIDVINTIPVIEITKNFFNSKYSNIGKEYWLSLIYKIVTMTKKTACFKASDVLTCDWEDLKSIFSHKIEKYFKDILTKINKTRETKKIIYICQDKEKDSVNEVTQQFRRLSLITLEESKFNVMRISKFLEKVNKTSGRKNKLKICTELFEFLVEKKEWVNTNPKFKKAILEKLKFFKEEEGWEKAKAYEKKLE